MSKSKKHQRNEIPSFVAVPDPARYLGDRYVVIDFETIVKDGLYGSAVDSRNSLALCCWGNSSDGYSSCWGTEYYQQGLIEAIKNADFVVAHNAKYELGWLKRIGADLSRILVFDTKIAEYVLLGNLAAGDADSGVKRVSTSLNDCCARRGYLVKDPIVDLWMKHGISVEDMPKAWVEDRCIQDVKTTEQLFLDQRQQLQRTARLGVVYTRCLLTPVLAAIEAEGMHLDENRVTASFSEHSERLAGLERTFAEITGGINFRSTKQVAGFLYDTLGFRELTKRGGEPIRGKSGARLVGAKVLARLRPETEDQRRFLEIKGAIGKVSAALSKNLNYFKEVCSGESNGIFHAEFNQTVTATHRLSSTGIKTPGGHSCQLTNIPRAFKGLFSSRRSGWLVAEADGSQLEFRVAAFLGNDRQARSDISDPEWDAHCVTAAAMVQKPYEEVYAAYKAGASWAVSARQAAKSETFKPLYGGSKGTPAQERWYAEFKQRYPDLAKRQEDWVYEVMATKRLITPWGLRYYFPHARMSDSGYCNVGSAVYNYPIQALATAEIIPIAITYFWHRVRGEGLDSFIIPVNTVHDSLVCEIHPEHADDFRRLARLAFGSDVHSYLHAVYGMDFDVPLGTGVKIGTHWGEGHEEKYEYLAQ